ADVPARTARPGDSAARPGARRADLSSTRHRPAHGPALPVDWTHVSRRAARVTRHERRPHPDPTARCPTPHPAQNETAWREDRQAVMSLFHPIPNGCEQDTTPGYAPNA